MDRAVRVLFVADSHLGFDLPARPRVERRRRGPDFLANYARALEPALRGEADLVVHGGDVFDRPAVISTVAFQAFEPLRRIADRGIPVLIVPGNHERSSLPHLRFARHPAIHVFDRPRTFLVTIRGTRVALAGFPYQRREVRTRFADLISQSAWRPDQADLHLLCVHHCVEGATVGPADYVFRAGPDVIRPRDVPPEFAAVLSGHIHRHQVLTTDLSGRRLAVPVLYPGSIERTSVAEIDEPKGFLRLDLVPGARSSTRWTFEPLPARPMIRRSLAATDLGPEGLDRAIRALVAEAPADAVVSIRVTGTLHAAQWRRLSASHLRTFVPETMNVEISPEGRAFGRRRLPRPPSAGPPEEPPSLFDAPPERPDAAPAGHPAS